MESIVHTTIEMELNGMLIAQFSIFYVRFSVIAVSGNEFWTTKWLANGWKTKGNHLNGFIEISIEILMNSKYK